MSDEDFAATLSEDEKELIPYARECWQDFVQADAKRRRQGKRLKMTGESLAGFRAAIIARQYLALTPWAGLSPRQKDRLTRIALLAWRGVAA